MGVLAERCLIVVVALALTTAGVATVSAGTTVGLTVRVEPDWIEHHARAEFDSVVDAAVAYYEVSNPGDVPITLHTPKVTKDSGGVAVLGPITTDPKIPCEGRTCTIEPGRRGQEIRLVAEALASSFLKGGKFGGGEYVLLPGARHLFAVVFVTQDQKTYEPLTMELKTSTFGQGGSLPIPLSVGADEGRIIVKPI